MRLRVDAKGRWHRGHGLWSGRRPGHWFARLPGKGRTGPAASPAPPRRRRRR
jgi:hypothetical protein